MKSPGKKPGKIKLYTYDEVAAEFKVHESTVRRWFKGRPKFKKALAVRITEKELTKFIAEFTKRSRSKLSK